MSRHELPLSRADRAAYQAIAAGDPPETDVSRLLAVGLVTLGPHNGEQNRYIAHDPRMAARRLMGEAQALVTDTVARMAEIPAIEELATDFLENRWYGGPGSEFLDGPDEMNARIGEVLSDAMHRDGADMLTAQPGAPVDRDPGVQRLGMERTSAALACGITVRSVYNGAAYHHPQSCSYLDDVTSAGAQVVTLEDPFPRMVIVGQANLFIDNLANPAGTNAGCHVTDRATVAWARHIFELAWERGTRWRAVRASPSVLTARQRAILGVLEEGRSQKKVGPALGLAERTVTKELAAARAAAGAQSLYQLMAWWGREGGK
ncbi:LuxR C-terminal-related transcriptional regulator [uncultured Streptomyces sp.]|uniref:LuxR C-terminal-related transcriptional regulator n=1 Tax=uncultured Streptomyces sp. TaxID=174707 RepID=UPI0026037D9E|nr:LuxR C-terminal-related transcriptional regulator [uncultured Streptomyces sp.]